MLSLDFMSSMLNTLKIVILILHVTMLRTEMTTSVVNTIPKPHPYVYYNQEDVPGLLEKSKTSHKVLYEGLRRAVDFILDPNRKLFPPPTYEQFASKWNEMYGNNLPPIALVSVLEPNNSTLLSLALKYMRIMCSYKNWYVASSPKDEVPVSHSLVGFATAYDFLHPRIPAKDRKAFLNKIVLETEVLYKSSLDRWWGNAYLQNHVFSNYVAMLHGALISMGTAVQANVWLAHAQKGLEYNMELLKHVTDGSLDEGVAYGSYSSRSLTQYVFLAGKHFNINHFNHPWLREHFNFYYNTIVPGYQYTVGIGDSNRNWFYGPESQLVFLDSYVLKNGWGNWLADQIRRSTAPFNFCTLHTEFLWYNASINPTPPPEWDQQHFHHFNDWGVASLRTGSVASTTSSFFSMKSGAVTGRPMKQMIITKRLGVRNLNAGHEHPDQNSMVVFIKGVPIMTEDFYNSKYSFANNVYMFKQAGLSSCVQGWVGQVGDCSKWFLGLLSSRKVPEGKLISRSFDNYTLMVGEAVDAYPSELGVNSVRRHLVTLTDDLIAVVDVIKKSKASTTNFVSTFFNNKITSYMSVYYLALNISGVRVKDETSKCVILWKDNLNRSPEAVVKVYGDKSSATDRFLMNINKVPLNNVNVTWALDKDSLTMAYIITCGKHIPYDFEVFDSDDTSMVKFSHGWYLYTIDVKGQSLDINTVKVYKESNFVPSHYKMCDALIYIWIFTVLVIGILMCKSFINSF